MRVSISAFGLPRKYRIWTTLVFLVFRFGGGGLPVGGGVKGGSRGREGEIITRVDNTSDICNFEDKPYSNRNGLMGE